MSAHSTMILVNPQAREGEVGRRWPDLEHQVLGVLGEGSARVEFTSALDYGSGAIRKALKEGIERILVVGGDGTVSEAIQGFFEEGRLISKDAILMVMPAGRGDDFFKAMVGHRCLSSDDAWMQGLELIRSGKPQYTDLGSVVWIPRLGKNCQDRVFINVASFGFPGLVVKRVRERAGVLGRTHLGKSGWTYLIQIVTGMMGYTPVLVEVRVDDEMVFDGPIFSGFVMNGCYNAGGMRWSDEAHLDDGIFQVVLAEPRGLLATALTGSRILSGHWKGVPGVHCLSGRKIEIRSKSDGKRGFPLFEIDGEQPEPSKTQGAVFEVLAGAIRLWK
ncbi:diacylglycerol kinase family protein [Bdellovibrionota bacterium FG-1]